MLNSNVPAQLTGTNQRPLVCWLSAESKLREQCLVLVEARIFCCQQLIAIENAVGPSAEHHELLRVAEAQPPSTQPDHGPRHDYPGGSDHPGHVEGVHGVDLLVVGRVASVCSRATRSSASVLSYCFEIVVFVLVQRLLQ